MCGALESDLQTYLRVSLKGLLTKPRTLTYRQVIMYIRHLPSESALNRRNFAGDIEPSFSERLAVAQVNELRLANYLYTKAHIKEDADLDFPELIELDRE